MKLIRALKHRLILLRSALVFAALGTGALALGVGLIWRVLQRDNTAFLQQSIGDASSMLAIQVKLEVARLERVLTELGQLKLKSSLLNSTPDPASPPEPSTLEVTSIETDPEISDVALWRKSDAQSPVTERAILAVNSRFEAEFPNRMSQIQALEPMELSRIEPAFHGHGVVLSATFEGTPRPMVFVAFPLGHGEVSEVVTAHVDFGKIQSLFSVDGLVQSELVDLDGLTLAHPDPHRIAQKENEAGRPLFPLFEHLRGASTVESGLQILSDPEGRVFYGGFRRISSVGLSVLTSVSAEQSGSSLEGVRNQLLIYLGFMFGVLALGRYIFLSHKPPAASVLGTVAGETKTGAVLTPRKLAVQALHGSLRGFNQLLDTAGPEEATEALNDYLLTAATLTRAHGGNFETYAGVSFVATWEINPENPASAQAVACALALRAEMARLNESRKLDGKKFLKQGMGLHIGQALNARIGAAPDLRPGMLGEALACARVLDRLALSEGVDFVASQDAIKAAHGVFTGQRLGEARLTGETGLTDCYTVVGYTEDWSLTEGSIEPGSFGGSNPQALSADERLTSGESRMQIARPATAPDRWLVNNGSQIVGPFAVPELSKMLFAQELDFDCECWHEESGRSSRLDAAGAFSGSEDIDAIYWVYDGELLHGPVSEGFLRTAFQRGAFKEDASVCVRSTTEGWKKLGALLDELTARKPGTDWAAKAG